MSKTALLLIICCGLYSLPAMAQDKENEIILALRQGDDFMAGYMYSPALIKYGEAMRVAKEIGDSALYTKALLGTGRAIYYSGNFAGAADTVKLALQLFKNSHDVENTGFALRMLASIYDDKGDYENALKATRENLELLKDVGHDQNKTLALVQMGMLYKNIGDYSSALEYYAKAQEEHPYKGAYEYREMNRRIGELYMTMNKPDSAGFFYRNAFIGNPNSKIIRLRIGESYLVQNKPDSAFVYLDKLYKEAKEARDINMLISTMLGLGKVYLAWKELPTALYMAQGSFDLSAQRDAIQDKRDASQLLSSIYEAQGEASKALQYQKLYEKIKDAVISDQLKGQLYAFKQQAEKSKQQEAIKELNDARKRAQQTILIISLAAVLLFILLTLRHKNEKLRLKQHAAELEMQALRAQMNPHFIFNCLSAINHFILNRDSDKASEYLTRFSRLIRMVLINAGKPTIPLDEELAMLKLYLDMEQLRFKDAFDYYIYFDATVKPSMIDIPSFILQPFCENAIWHGLLHKEGRGQLTIYFKMEKGVLICTIKDNGIGIEKAAEIKTQSTEKRASFGHKLGAERLALFNRESDAATSFTIQDLKDEAGNAAGTLVTLKIKNKVLYD